jgi:cell division protein FtsL
MSRPALRSAIDWCYRKRIITILVLLLTLLFALFATASGLVICPEHGVKSAFTGNRQVVFNGSKRHDYCEYSHVLRDLSGTHKFWSDCE